MTGDVVARARAALEGVTDGPWATESDDYSGTASLLFDRISPHGVRVPWPLFQCPDCGVRGEGSTADAEFIAAARYLVPELVDVVELLRQALVDQRRKHEAESLRLQRELMRERELRAAGVQP